MSQYPTKADMLSHDAFTLVEQAIFKNQLRNVKEVASYLRTFGFNVDYRTIDQLIYAAATQYK